MPEDEKMLTEAATHLRSIVTAGAITSAQDPQASSHQHYNNRTLQELHDAARADPSFVHLLNCVTSGFPTNWYLLHASLLMYWKLCDNLYTDGELVLYSCRIVLPASHRRHALAHLHDSHR